MIRNNLTAILFSLLSLSCVSMQKIQTQTPTPGGAFNLLQDRLTHSNVPLAGSYDAGAQIFNLSNGTTEAEAAFKSKGPYLILFCGVRCSPEGEDGIPIEQIGAVMKEKAYRHVFVPGSTDVWSTERTPYLKAALKYIGAFNKRMIELQNRNRDD